MIYTKDLCASAIQCLVRSRFWIGNNQKKQLASASRRLARYAKSHGLSIQLKKLTHSNLGWGTGRCPEVRCKGYDTYVILSWLVSEVTSRDCGTLPFLAFVLILMFFLSNKWKNNSSIPASNTHISKATLIWRLYCGQLIHF